MLVWAGALVIIILLLLIFSSVLSSVWLSIFFGGFFGIIYPVIFFFNLPTAGSSASGWTVFFLLNSLQEVLHSGVTVIFPLPTTQLDYV
jgi:hypothetical protein